MEKYIELTCKKKSGAIFTRRIYVLRQQTLKQRIKTLSWHYEHGKQSGYPLCCIIKFGLFQVIFNNYFTNKIYPYSISSILERRLCPYHFCKELIKGNITIQNYAEIDRKYFGEILRAKFKSDQN